MGSVRASMKAVVVVALAAVMLGGLALVAPAAPIRRHAVASDTTNSVEVTTGDTTDPTPTPVPGEIVVTVKGPGKVNTCGPPIDGSTKEKECLFFGQVGRPRPLSATAQTDNAHTQGRFDGWNGGGCSGTAPDCTVLFTADTTSVTATFTDVHPAAVPVDSPKENELVITHTGSTPVLFSPDEPLDGATCQVDSASPQPCSTSGNATVTVADAAGDPTLHTLKVRGNDRWAAAGLGTTGDATRHWRAYVTQDTSIDGGPANGAAINSRTATFAFSATKTPATTRFTCTLDTVTDTNCQSGRPWPDLSEGRHTFSVASTVDFGSSQKATDLSPAVRTFTVDLTPPDTSIADGPAEGLLTNERSASFVFTSNEPGASFECSLNGSAFGDCPGGVNGGATYADVGVGPASFAVRAVDGAGNREALPATRAWTVTADLDGDGFTLPGDCDDHSAAIHPGATEILDNGVDENCNGVGELNLDRDGDRFPRPQDCNDGDATIHPGSREIVGNAVDENCDRLVDPFPSLPSSVGYNWVPRGRATVLKSFFVRNAQAGSTIKVACRRRGGRCSIASRTTQVSKTAHVVDLTRLVRGRALSAGTVLEVTMTKPQTIGAFTSLKMRAKGGPLKQERCLPPGARSPQAC
jgi:hypothetical protein